MNILDKYLTKIRDTITKNYKILNIESDVDINGFVVEVPPLEFNFDLSINVCLILAKKIKQSPIKLAESVKKIIKDNLDDFSDIEIAGPGFSNLMFTPEV